MSAPSWCNDCSIFSLAFTSVLTQCSHPSAYDFDPKNCGHICTRIWWLIGFYHFPSLGWAEKTVKNQVTYCRMPNVGDPMIQGCTCQKWFHLDLCVNIGSNKLKMIGLVNHAASSIVWLELCNVVG